LPPAYPRGDDLPAAIPATAGNPQSAQGNQKFAGGFPPRAWGHWPPRLSQGDKRLAPSGQANGRSPRRTSDANPSFANGVKKLQFFPHLTYEALDFIEAVFKKEAL
jgi:hypothetical protein